MVPGGSPLHEANQAGPFKASISPGREIARFGVDLIVVGGQSVNRGLRRRAEKDRQVFRRSALHLPVQTLLHGKVDSPRPYVANFEGVLAGENMLNAKTPCFRIRQFLVGNIARSYRTSIRAVGNRRDGR